MTTLRACPFCGCQGDHLREWDQEGIAWINCGECSTDGPTSSTLEEAIALWNSRPGDAEPFPTIDPNLLPKEN